MALPAPTPADYNLRIIAEELESAKNSLQNVVYRIMHMHFHELAEKDIPQLQAAHRMFSEQGRKMFEEYMPLFEGQYDIVKDIHKGKK